MRRRDLLKLVGSGAICWALSARAQQPSKTYRLGYLASARIPNLIEALQTGLRELVAPNHLLFRKDAIDACLSLRVWDGAERHGAALEDFVRPEPMPWSTFIISRARALAGYGRGRRDRLMMSELERLRSEGDRLGIHLPLRA